MKLHLGIPKLFCKYFLLAVSFWLISFNARSQTTLAPGEIAFVGYISADDGVNGATQDDEFAFILLKDITTGTIIKFTDFGWLTAGGFQTANPCGPNTGAINDGIITWTATGNMSCGTQVRIKCKYTLQATAGTVTGTQACNDDPTAYLSLAIGGDQIFAYQGAHASPTLLAGISINKPWDAALVNCFFSSNSSVLPPALGATANTTAVSAAINAKYDCSLTNELPPNLIVAINNPANWLTDNTFAPPIPAGFQLPLSCSFSCAPGPNISVSAVSGTITACQGTASASPDIQQFTASGSLLTADILVTAPANFEVSTSSGSGYGPSLTLIQAGGSVPLTTIYVRSSASAPAGPISGNVVLTSTGATTRNVAVAGTINPIPDAVATPSAQTICSGAAITTIVLSGSVAGTIYNWTRDNTVAVTGIAVSGSGNISGSLTNTTAAPVIVTFTITPSFTNAGVTCTGTAITATVTVNPLIDATITGGGVTVCGGSTVTLSAVANVNYAYQWARQLATEGFTNLGTGQTQAVTASGIYQLTVTQLGCSVSSTTVVNVADYVFNGSLGAGDPQQTGRINRFGIVSTCAAPKACPGIFTAVGARFYDSYIITNIRNTPVCATIGINSGCGTNIFNVAYLTSFNPAAPCTNYLGDPGSSFAASGFMEVTIPALGTIEVVVHEVNVGTGCGNYTLTVDVPREPAGITVSPAPTVCNGAPITLTASAANTYLWSPGGATTQSIIQSIFGTVNYTVTLGYGNTGCTAIASQTVSVFPTPDATATPASQTSCSGNAITTIVLTGTVPGTTFNWTRDNTVAVTGIAAGGSGNISGTLTNTTNVPVTVTFTITPTANGCFGTPITATVLVNPTPDAVATPSSQIICSANPITTIVLSGAVGGTTFSWTRDNLVNLTGIAASGSGNISGTLTNTTNAAQTTTFTITPTANGCVGTAITATVTVNPTPIVNPVPNQTVCNGAPTAPVTFSGPVAGTTFNWINNTPSIGLAASGSGNIASFNAINLTNAPVTATITVTPVTTPTGTVTFNYTGAFQTFVVPAGVTSISIQALGAQGMANAAGVALGGLGGSASGNLTVTPGETLWVYVGGGGSTGATGGFNGGGNGGTTGTCLTALGGGGGGASDVRQTANTLAGRKIVAGGGGGTAGNRVVGCARGAGGGGGGGYYGGGGGCGYPGTTGVVPTGGTQAAGGAGGITGTTFGATNGLPGALGIGGAGGNEIFSNQAGSQAVIFGSGTGGGLTGGSGQQSGLNNFTGQSGAGGSSYIGGVTGGSTTAGVRSGNGLVTISYATAGPTCTGPSTSFTITVNPTPNAVATPSTQTICSGSAMTPIVLSGNVAGTVFNWTRNNIVNVTGIPNAGSGNISGTPINNTTVQQTVTYTITPVANGCTGPSITATLIVNIAPTITCPANITVNNTPGQCGANVTYPPATATGSPAPVITYSQASGTFFPVGTTTVTATATNICGVATCTFTITVLDVQAPTITCPANIVAGTDVGACVATVATPNPVTADNCAVTAVTWVMTGATTGSSPATGINYVGTRAFNLNGTTGQGITTVTYTVKDAAGNTSTCSFTVTVNDAWIPVIGGQPTNQTVCVGSNAVFSVTASVPAGNPLTYQWQSWNGSAWVNIAGATNATLPLNAVTFSMNTNSYRCILTGRCSVVTSGFATLYVNQLPTISLVASGTLALLPGHSVNITTIVNPGGGSYQWFKNGIAIAGATGASLNGLTVDDIGSYTCRYTDLNGCVAISAAMVVSGQVSDGLFIYPNPNTGHFHIRVYNQSNEEITVRIFDMKGAMLYLKKVITAATPYTDIEVELMSDRITSSETYIVEVRGTGGRLIGSKKIIVYK